MDENHLSKKLEERIKELNTLYRTSKIITQSHGDLEDTLKRIARVIPTGWQYPEICTCRITVGDVVATSSRFKEGEWRQSEEIFLEGKSVGLLEVFYLAQRPEIDEGPFLLEERNLIIELTDRISEFLKILESKNELEYIQSKYRNLFGEKREAIIYFGIGVGGQSSIYFCNRNAEELLGLDCKDLIGSDVIGILGDNGPEVLSSALNDPCTQEKREIVLRDRQGQEVTCTMEMNVFHLSGKKMALMILMP